MPLLPLSILAYSPVVNSYFSILLENLVVMFLEEIVNRIRVLCRSKNTSITKIEEELRFANGTIGKWKNGKRMPPLEKVILIADRLDTTPEYILRGEQQEKPAPNGGEPKRNVIKVAGRDGSFVEKHLTDEQLKAWAEIVKQLPDADDL